MIKTIIFDLGEVYLTGLKATEDHLVKAWKVPFEDIYQQMHIQELKDFFHGKISEKEYFEAVIKNSKWEISVEELKKLVRVNFREIEGTRKIVECLKKNGYRLGILSIHAKEWVKYCDEKFDYHKLFHSILYSFEAEASKPDKKVYEMIISKLGSRAEECIFIDDQEKNLVPARELGINAILFKNSKQLKKDLIDLGIKV